MGKGDSKHKSRFAGKKRRQRKHLDRVGRKALDVHNERAVAHGGRSAQVLQPKQPQMKRVVLQTDGRARCPHCSYMNYFGHPVPGVRVLQCGSCRKNFELEVKEEQLQVVPITYDDYVYCPACKKKIDVLHTGGTGIVVACGCGHRLKLGQKQPKPADPLPPPPPSVASTKLQAKRSGKSPWCTCPRCLRGVRISGSYTAAVDAECPHCGLEFTALPA